MSVDIRLDQTFEKVPQVNLHHIPCKIEANESANISKFFCPKSVKTESKETLSASFRGRPLDGKKITLPDGYIGAVITEKQRPFSEEENRALDVTGKFKVFTKWYLGSQFAGGNSMDKACLTWTSNLASVIHDPVEPKHD
ncbi:ribonuclease H2 subunit C-like [Ciona intestinalis]